MKRIQNDTFDYPNLIANQLHGSLIFSYGRLLHKEMKEVGLELLMPGAPSDNF